MKTYPVFFQELCSFSFDIQAAVHLEQSLYVEWCRVYIMFLLLPMLSITSYSGIISSSSLVFLFFFFPVLKV
jgi:hypothetical protein